MFFIIPHMILERASMCLFGSWLHNGGKNYGLIHLIDLDG